MKTSWKVTLMKKGTAFEGKEVVVQAENKLEAEKNALKLQHPFPNKWTVMTIKLDNDSMETKFRHKGLRSFI